MSAKLAQLRARRGRGAFTLIETAMALIIVGVGVVASMRLFASCSQQNTASTQMTLAMHLSGNIREAMSGLAFDDPNTGTGGWGPETGETLANYNDVDDFDGLSFNPPIDSLRSTITSMGQYTQVVTVVPIFPNKLNSNVDDASPEIPDGTYTGAVRIRVRILYQRTANEPTAEVYRCAWVRLDN
jgi:hypothetical protein